MTTQTEPVRLFNRQMLRSAFQSLFWHVLLVRKRESGFSFKALAERLGNNKSYVSRSFGSPPNWQIDKLSDMADALGVELILQARDIKNGQIYTPSGSIVGSSETMSARMSDLIRYRLPDTSTSNVEDGTSRFRIVGA